MSRKHINILLVQAWLTLCLLANQQVPSDGFFMSSKKSVKPLMKTQTNDLGARTMLYIVSNGDGGHFNGPLPQPRKTRRVRRDKSGKQKEPKEPTILLLEINGQITSRFAMTTVDSIIENKEDEDLEAMFTVQLPETAFISNFTMLIDNVFYEAEVKGKAEAQKEYDQAKERNETAGQVSSAEPMKKERGMEAFNIAINVKAQGTAVFTLTYQQLLARELGVYEYIASVRPRQIVDRLSLNVKVYEPEGLKYNTVEIYEPGQKGLSQTIAVKTEISSKLMELSYIPDRAHQEAIAQQGDYNGLDDNFVIRYDIEHGKDAGHVVMDGGFFVHYFSPSEMDPQPKNIVFVMDRSGSMQGKKIKQTRDAMLYILDFLRPTDMFQMIYFDSDVTYWSGQELEVATPNMVQKAKGDVLEKLVANSATNINSALLAACRILKDHNTANQEIKGKSYIVFLTDGLPSHGVRDPRRIIANVKEAAGGFINVFSLGFGFDLDLDLLKNISAETNGAARRVYEGLDAQQQIQNIIKGINSPLMFDVQLQYDSNAIIVDSLTKSAFPQYFNGSELIVAGKLQSNQPASWSVNVIGVSGENTALKFEKSIVSMEEDLDVIENEGVIVAGFAERLWAYLKIKDILIQRRIGKYSSQDDQLLQQALDLALQYKLVTPITSFIISTGDNKKSKVFEDSRNRVSVFGSGASNISGHIFHISICVFLSGVKSIFNYA